jgi:WD40 repeat protein
LGSKNFKYKNMKKNLIIHLCLLCFLPFLLKAQNPKLIIPTLIGVQNVAWIEDQNLLISAASYDKNIQVWQAKDGRLLSNILLPGEYDEVEDIAVSAASKNVAIVSKAALYWLDVKTLSLQKSVDIPKNLQEQQGNFTSAIFSKDGQTLYIGAGNYGEITLFSIKKGEKALKKLGSAFLGFQDLDPVNPEMVESARKGVAFLSLSPDGKTLLASAGPKEIFSFSTLGGIGKKLMNATGQSAQYLPNSQVVVSDCSLKGTSNVQVLDGTFKPLWNKEIKFKIEKLEAFPKSNQCFLANRNEYMLLNTDTKNIGVTKQWPNDNFVDLAFTSDEKQVVYGTTSPTLSLFDIAKNSDLSSIGVSIFLPSKIHADPASNWFLMSSSNAPISKAMRIQDGQLVVKTLPEISPKFCALSSDGKQGIWTGSDGKDYYFNTQNAPVQFEEIADNTGEHYGVTFSKDGSLFATSTQTGLLIFDSKTKELVATLEVENYQILEGAFSEDNTHFVASSGAGTSIFGSHCWEIPSGKVIWQLNSSNYTQFRFIEKDAKIQAFSRDTSCLLDAKSGKRLSQGAKMEVVDYAHRFYVAPDGDVAVDTYLKNLYDLKTGKATKLPGLTGDFAILKGSNAAFTNAFNEEAIPTDQLILYDLKKQKNLAQIYLFNDNNEWIVLAPDGRFDASKGAMNAMYWAKGSTLIPLSALSDRFYTPKLLHLLIGKDSDVAPVDINTIKNPPTVKMKVIEPTQRSFVVVDQIATVEVNGDKVKISIEAKSDDDAIAEIRLFHNGKRSAGTTRNLVVEDEKSTSIKVQTFDIQLVAGENNFKASAFNTQRTESEPDELRIIYKPNANTVLPSAKDIQLWLVVVGINEYKNKKYNLNYASADAKAFKEAMEKQSNSIFSKINTTYITNTEATKSGIIAALDKVSTGARPQDVFLFYYAGHGVVSDNKQFYLVPTDVTQLYGNDGGLESNGLSAKVLRQYATNISAQKQLFVLDACQSEGALTDAMTRGAAEEKALEQLARSTGTYWLTASGSEQFASEFSQLGHGAFTYTLLEAISGKADTGDNQITVQEIDAYLQKIVPELTEKYKGTPQYPASYGLGNDFPIGVVR